MGYVLKIYHTEIDMYCVREIIAFRGGILFDSASFLCSSVSITVCSCSKTSSEHSFNHFKKVVYL